MTASIRTFAGYRALTNEISHQPMLSSGVDTNIVSPNHITRFPDVFTQAQNPTVNMVNKKNNLAASLGVDHPR